MTGGSLELVGFGLEGTGEEEKSTGGVAHSLAHPFKPSRVQGGALELAHGVNGGRRLLEKRKTARGHGEEREKGGSTRKLTLELKKVTATAGSAQR